MLSLQNITKKFDGFVAVDNLSFVVRPGEILALLGTNGSGKTTTFRMIINLYTPDFGEILYNNKPIDKLSQKNIGYLIEERALFKSKTVYEQLKFFAQLKKMDKNQIDTSIKHWLLKLNMIDKKDKKVQALSKGNQQKIQFISAILHDPDLLILDEPFSGFDSINIELFKNIILDLKAEGKIIIFSSHRLDHIENFCEEVIILKNGKPIVDGKISQLRRSMKINHVKLKADIRFDDLEGLSYVKNLYVDRDYFYFEIEEYNNIKKLNNDLLKDVIIEHLSIELPTFEEFFVQKLGDDHE